MAFEHGGDLDRAIAKFGGERADWIDLSTGINPHSYEIPLLADDAWTALPDSSMNERLIGAAKHIYQSQSACLALAGAQQAIQYYPTLFASKVKEKKAALIHPSYNEHEAQLQRDGWQIKTGASLADLEGTELAVIVNPNNPDGTFYTPDSLLKLATSVRFLVVDESFCDPYPDLSLCPHITDKHDNILILRSFGKFYGLAGMRLGFALGSEAIIDKLAEMAGRWPVSGPALAIGKTALQDKKWADSMTVKLHHDAERLDNLASRIGWQLVGGTNLFRLYDCPDAAAAQDILARHKIWSRIFSYNSRWLRLGLPPENGWQRLSQALTTPSS